MTNGSFLQSKTWESFQHTLGVVTRRVEGVLVVEKKTPVGPYWYVARAVLTDANIEKLIAAAKEARAVFLRIDPAINSQLTTDSPQFRPTLPTSPQDTLVLDLAPSTDELLASFHSKTRYNIRLAERKGVVIEESADAGHRDFRAFIELGKRTGSRQEIRFHSESYYQKMLETLQTPELSASVVVAHWNNRPLAANLMLWAGTTGYYLHGASWHEHRQFMAPHLLQWACIQRAKERGCTQYDLWGIAPGRDGGQQVGVNTTTSPTIPTAAAYEFDEAHPWAGITRFKLGFGGDVVHSPNSFDVVLNPTTYSIYTMGRRIRRQFRGL